MPNQYKLGPANSVKCENAACTNRIRRTDSDIEFKKKRYCCKECQATQRDANMKYNKEGIKWIQDNAVTKSRAEMALHFGVEPGSFRKMLVYLRKKGHDIPHKIGLGGQSILTETQRSWIVENYNTYTRVEMEGMTNIPRNLIKNFTDHLVKKGELQKKYKTPNYGRQPKGDKTKGVRKHADRKPPVEGAKQKIERIPTRVIDESSLISVRINSKTVIRCRDEAHAEKVRKQYEYLNKNVVSRI